MSLLDEFRIFLTYFVEKSKNPAIPTIYLFHEYLLLMVQELLETNKNQIDINTIIFINSIMPSKKINITKLKPDKFYVNMDAMKDDNKNIILSYINLIKDDTKIINPNLNKLIIVFGLKLLTNLENLISCDPNIGKHNLKEIKSFLLLYGLTINLDYNNDKLNNISLVVLLYEMLSFFKREFQSGDKLCIYICINFFKSLKY